MIIIPIKKRFVNSKTDKYFELFSAVNRCPRFPKKMKSIESIFGRSDGFLCFSIMQLYSPQYQLFPHCDPKFAEMLKGLQR